ncbi:MAG: hypothetical protein H7Z21_13870 [Hymenobacter sp.]|nr:hypothetical protein [Hymenobacter sp.]
MNRTTCFSILVFWLFFSEGVLASTLETPDSAPLDTVSMYQWGLAEGRAYAALISNSSLSANEKTAVHATTRDEAERNMDEAINAAVKDQIEFWEGYYLGLGKPQLNSQALNRKASAKRFRLFAPRAFDHPE